jgi:cytochrome c oxidase subunit 4
MPAQNSYTKNASGHSSPLHATAEHTAVGHIVPLGIYLGIFVTLLVLTGITTMVAFVDLGRWNTVVALAIAVSKMALVILYFMHLRYSAGLTRIVVVASFLWLGILISLTLSDVLTRHWTPSPQGWGSSSEISSNPPQPVDSSK